MSPPEFGKWLVEQKDRWAKLVGGEFVIMPELVSETDFGSAVAKHIDRA